MGIQKEKTRRPKPVHKLITQQDSPLNWWWLIPVGVEATVRTASSSLVGGETVCEVQTVPGTDSAVRILYR
jgi:hypothetical protein